MPSHRRDGSAVWLPVCLLVGLLSLLGQACSPALAQWRTTGADHDNEVMQIARDVKTDPGDVPVLKLPDGTALPLTLTSVDADVTGPVARVRVTQRYENPNPEPIEAIYVFPLPENSAVDAMRMRIGARIIDATIKERAAARRTYERAKRRGKTAALLEQQRPNVFTQSVANIAPGEAIEVTVTYVQHLTYDAGEYEFVFPMVVGPRFTPGARNRRGPAISPDTRVHPPILGYGTRSGHDIRFSARIDPGLPIADFAVPTHVTELSEYDDVLHVKLAAHDRQPNRDLVMRWRVDADAPQTALFTHREGPGQPGYFTLVVQPPTLDVDAEVGRRELIFVVDVSGSMRGTPLSIAKDALGSLLDGLRPVDTFNVVTFAGQTGELWRSPRPANQANLTYARRFIDGQRGGGGTYMADAVERALRPGDTRRHRYVVFLTDGYISNERAIFADAEQLVTDMAAHGQRAKVFALGVGSSVNRHLLDGIAKAGDGLSRVITLGEKPAEVVNVLQRAIDRPVLRDVHIDWGGLPIDEVQPRVLPDLFATRPLVIHGRYRGTVKGTITVHGRLGDETVALPVETHLPAEAPDAAVRTLWARAKVAELERDLWQGHDETTAKAITRLGLDFGLVTRFTSFVAVDHERIVGGGAPRTVHQPVPRPAGLAASGVAPTRSIAQAPVAPMPVAAPPAARPSPVDHTPRASAPTPRRRTARHYRPRANDEVDDLLGNLDGGGNKARGAAPKAAPADPALPERLSKRQIIAEVRRWAARLSARCGVAQPMTVGTVLALRPDGRVSILHFRGAVPRAVQRCMRAESQQWRVPQFSGSVTRVTMPFRLRPR